jgi:phosphatidate cytidylyltransferase
VSTGQPVTGTIARIATAALLIPIVVAAIWWGPPTLIAILVAALIVGALLEFFALGERAGFHGYRGWTAFCAVLIVFQQWTMTGVQTWTLGRDLRLIRTPTLSQFPSELVLLIFVVGVALQLILSTRPIDHALGDIGISASGLVFLAVPLSALVRLEGVTFIGRQLLLFTLVLIWVGDTAAYFVGRWFGRTPMAAIVSPRKTWEGAAANLIGSVVVGMAFAPSLHLEARSVVWMAAFGNVGGQIGDLLESAYKRSAGVKDSGTLLPGHGGVLDRIDALVLAAPMVWYYFHYVLSSRV